MRARVQPERHMRFRAQPPAAMAPRARPEHLRIRKKLTRGASACRRPFPDIHSCITRFPAASPVTRGRAHSARDLCLWSACETARSRLLQLPDNNIIQAIAKHQAFDELYEHSNGFRAVNFCHSLQMRRSIHKNQKLASLRHLIFAHSASFAQEEVHRLVQIV